MQKIVSDNLWPEIRRLAKRAGRRMAAVAYATDDQMISFRAGDMLVVDASDGAITSRQTSRDLVASAVRANASVYHCRGLHAKVFVFDRVAIVGSANLSRSSANHLIEAAVMTDSPAMVAAARDLIERLAAGSTVVDAKFLRHLRSLKLAKSSVPFSRRARTIKVASVDPRTWVVTLTELDEGSYPEERRDEEKGAAIAENLLSRRGSDVTWMRFTGRSRFRREAKVHDLVIQIQLLKEGKRVEGVWRHIPILRRQEEPRCTRFYAEEYAGDHKLVLSLSEFRVLLRKAGFKSKVGPNTVRAIPADVSERLHALWPKRK